MTGQARRVSGAVLALLWLGTAACVTEPEGPSAADGAFGADISGPATIRAIAAQVADWQLEHPKYEPTDWTNGVFYAGVLAAYRTTGDPKYLEVLIEVGESVNWRVGDRYRHADDHAIAQTYLDLDRPAEGAGAAAIEPKSKRYESFRAAIDRMRVEAPDWAKEHQPIDYWWCDALFMSPPAVAMLAKVTGDDSYLDFLDRKWREAYVLLFDESERLFHRDLRFRDEAEPRFWARGNGWVVAGLARLLAELPADRATRGFYEGVYSDLSRSLARLQGEDGLWRSNLHARAVEAPGESSGSALICFALAWGVHQGILDRAEFLPVVEAAWRGLAGNVSRSGRLGWVQKPGAKPGKASARDAEVYASGAFLLAAEQVLALELTAGVDL